MAHFHDTVDSTMEGADVFDYMADWTNAAEWDEGTQSARRLDSGEIGVGSKFELVVEFLGRQSPFVYEITEYERPGKLVLRAETDASVLVDTITIEPGLQGTSVLTYDARLDLKGVRKLVNPVMAIFFNRLCQKGKEGLERELNPA